VCCGKCLHTLARIVLGVVVHDDTLPALGRVALRGYRLKGYHQLLGTIVRSYDE
jgi:hypothetical protein